MGSGHHRIVTVFPGDWPYVSYLRGVGGGARGLGFGLSCGEADSRLVRCLAPVFQPGESGTWNLGNLGISGVLPKRHH